MTDDVTVLEDEIEAYADNTVARIRVLDVPESDKFPEGVKYAFHYGEAGGDTPSFDSTTTTATTNSTPAPTSTKSTTPDWTPSTERGGRHSPKRNAPTGSH